jgi:hypothetical protein
MGRVNPSQLPGVLNRQFVMSILLTVLGIWIALNLAIVAAMHFKPLRPRRRRSEARGSLAFARHRRRPF